MRSLIARFLSLIVGALLVQAPVQALTVDEYDGLQFLIAYSPDGSASSAIDSAGAIGGTRAITVKAQSNTPGLPIVVATDSGEFSHSQAASVTGESWQVWDGDLVVDNLNTSGLGGIDFTQDGATAFRLRVLSFDYPNAQAVNLRITLYDSTDPSGGKFSRAVRVLSAAINSVTNIDIPFSEFTVSGPNGAADLTSIGAVELAVDGKQSPAADLTFSWVGTNGLCELLPDSEGRVIDQCGVCGGDGTSCLDCAGQPFGSAVLDRCNVCNGDGKSCLGCEEKDQFPLLTALDGGAKKQEALIKKLTKRLGTLNRSKKIQSYNASTRAKAHTLQIRNWTLSWVLPVTAVNCENVEYCVSTSNTKVINEYKDNNVLLRDLTLEVIKKIKKYTGGVTAHSEVASAKKAEGLFQENLALVNSVPEFQDQCE